MNNKLVLVGMLVLMLCGVAAAADAEKAADPNEMDGKALFKTYCKSCHDVDADAGEYAPLHLIMDQWDEVFDAFDKTHAEASNDLTGGKPVGEFLGQKLLDKIRKFCVDHAADSEEPMTCG